MDFITSPPAIAEWSAQARRAARTVGFVPTMGALHEGHLDLVIRARAVCDLVACSIFVNPLQFNDAEDLKRYPRQLEKDRELLAEVGCNVLFAPEKEVIFADFQPFTYNLGSSNDHWEGPSRPGHFQGVVNVVERLFHFVRPDQAFFGEKDRQQLTILQHVGRTEHWPERIIPCPTVRAADGIALSSRNARLDPNERIQATVLYKALQEAAAKAFTHSVTETEQAALHVLGSAEGVTLDYFGIADADTLEPLLDWDGRDRAVALVAAQVGPVRLIDNITLVRR
ncbi:MAG: pantoate--beta-alanine ligase [Flavobacteriales bacterium]|nr:pantoate--beta-alanine ligase [Flavobacteriales bacterium]MBK6552019.1 pantoate--beta-alanine ligase [Flavobacteriales bacterium]MBK6883337.1 pantoate--beta-alanine ligase [Flavobacteriales bacterium]MBK7102979.1 pantoate--beta-alanine ligase [Flavobacteriales bacterium]MBK8531232.1 pantoate--beta-alanine ligase [Flavobacteriales bacterium]